MTNNPHTLTATVMPIKHTLPGTSTLMALTMPATVTLTPSHSIPKQPPAFLCPVQVHPATTMHLPSPLAVTDTYSPMYQ